MRHSNLSTLGLSALLGLGAATNANEAMAQHQDTQQFTDSAQIASLTDHTRQKVRLSKINKPDKNHGLPPKAIHPALEMSIAAGISPSGAACLGVVLEPLIIASRELVLRSLIQLEHEASISHTGVTPHVAHKGLKFEQLTTAAGGFVFEAHIPKSRFFFVADAALGGGVSYGPESPTPRLVTEAKASMGFIVHPPSHTSFTVGGKATLVAGGKEKETRGWFMLGLTTELPFGQNAKKH